MEKNKKNAVEPAKIQVTKTEEFDNTFDTKVTTFEELTKLINGLFSVFSDFAGANIRVPGQGIPVIQQLDDNLKKSGAMYVDLYFKDMGDAPEGTIKNIVPIEAKRKDGSMSMLDRYNNLTRDNSAPQHAYTVTKETYECLDELMFDGNNPKRRWADFTREIQQQNGIYARDGIMVVISGLSLEKIVGMIYGKKSKEGRYCYAVKLHCFDSLSFQMNTNSSNSKSIVTIARLDEAQIRKLISETNTMYPGNFVPIR